MKAMVAGFFVLSLLLSASFARANQEDRINEQNRHLEHWMETLSNNPLVLVRKNAAYFLGSLQDERAVQTLIKALGDRSALVRKEVAIALGNLGSEEALRELFAAKSIEVDRSVQREQERAIEKIKAHAEYQQQKKQRYLDLQDPS
ncbi:MAG: HEAT repeat domain-containing protein [Bdellovibrionales bacterium]|nr:HEAT repeat domain-containing protein [Bdellovibrionales bacterium]